ncbi:squalene monooxygenase [Sugiyamaella lignohabitans]|uniref:Squalene monooxygenase n=1 Tax=Sugiyamaella lignohabitans TaxID=796027 RepID=A0A167DWJ7_9ASCO|nr:squalene monooxygenase [Sugiyamaella lignohabitans]ANB13381.1 squalene monooxygenase [Sugiyamaella lignohabitans]
MSDRDYDYVIVGAGIAGPALAVGFAKSGRSVLVVERDLREPDRIVGELLQPGGVNALRELGIEHALEGIDAVPSKGYQVFYHGETVNIPYPTIEADGKTQEVTGRSFHHGRFVMNLRKAASETPGVTFLEANVTEIITNPHTGHVLGVKTVDKTGRLQHVSYFAKPPCSS